MSLSSPVSANTIAGTRCGGENRLASGRGPRWLCLAVLAAAVGSGCGGPEAQSPDGSVVNYWHGEYSVGELEWSVGLTFTGDCDSEPLLDVDSVWRARIAVSGFECTDQLIAFSLPWELGRFEGARLANSLAGTVVRSDGVVADLTLLPARRSKVIREGFSIDHEGVRVAATLALPEGDGPHPTVIVVHGSGDSSRTTEPYAFWADFLPRHGFAAVIYDKRGNGESTGDWRKVGFEPRARDVAMIADLLAARDDIAQGRIGLLAVSQGGWVGGLAASYSENISYLLRIAAPAVSALEADTYALVWQMRRDGFRAEEIDAAVAVWREEADLTRHLDSEEHWERYDRIIRDARSERWFDASGYTALTREDWFGEWYGKVLDHDPRGLLEASDLPMLWMYGAEDSQSDVQKNVAVLGEYRNQMAKDLEVLVYPDAGHGLLTAGESFPTVPTTFFGDLLDWLERKS